MLEALGLRKEYGAVTALHALSVTLRPGRIVGLVGNNGAGKTTTLKMLSGILRPTSGTVRLDGEDPALAQTRSRLGFLPEDSPLYDDQTPVGYLKFFASLYGMSPRETKQRTHELLTELRLDPPYWKRPIGQLSKGSARKVAIARCLLHNPDVLLLDEPASGLDPATRRELDALLLRLRESGKSILLSAHDLAQVERLCDEIVIVHQGRAVASGPLNELRESWGGWRYHVQATVPFSGSTPDGANHAAMLPDLAAAEAAMAQVRDAGGAVVHMESRPPSLDEILVRAAGE